MPYDLFISYSRRDNGQGDGRITQFVDRIGRNFADLAGRELQVFFDRSAIVGMEDWRHKILQDLHESRLLLACLTPSYFASEHCEWEFVEYLKNEVGRGCVGEGVAPVHFVPVPGWDDPDFDRTCAEWVVELRRRQRFDLRLWFKKGQALFRQAEIQARMAH